GWCLEVHNLAIAKLVAGRDKDLEFVRSLARRNYVQRPVLAERSLSPSRSEPDTTARLDHQEPCHALLAQHVGPDDACAARPLLAAKAYVQARDQILACVCRTETGRAVFHQIAVDDPGLWIVKDNFYLARTCRSRRRSTLRSVNEAHRSMSGWVKV